MQCTAFNPTCPSSFASFGIRFLDHRRVSEASIARNPPGLFPNTSKMRRRRLAPLASYLELPLLPFVTNEVLVPSESKTLHLYEARYLALLEERHASRGMDAVIVVKNGPTKKTSILPPPAHLPLCSKS